MLTVRLAMNTKTLWGQKMEKCGQTNKQSASDGSQLRSKSLTPDRLRH